MIFKQDLRGRQRPENPPHCQEGPLSDGSLSRGKVFFFWVIILLTITMLLDATCYVIVTSCVPSRIRARVGNGNPELRVAQREQPPSREPRIIRPPQTADSKQAKSSGLLMFHPALGWDYPPNIVYEDIDDEIYSHGPGGERITCASYGATAIATYGDSFTYCLDVGDADTWQTFLAHKIRSNVLNFGVGGYGTDQAFLKYQLHDDPVAKVVMLCIFPENINRIVNIYRPFYRYSEAQGLTKPRFIQEGAGFRLVPNPLTKVEDVAKLVDTDFIRQLGQLDYWYQLDQKLPSLSFPYSVSLFQWRKPIFEQITLSAARILPFNSPPIFPWNLFDEPEPFAIMCHIVDSFVKTVLSRGSTPVIIIMPYKDQVQELLDYRVSRIERLLSYMKVKGYRFIDVVQSVADMKPNRSQLEQWYHGHATREGNRIAAEIIAAYLEKNPGILK